MSNHQRSRQQAIRKSDTSRSEKRMFFGTLLVLVMAGVLVGINLFTASAQPEATSTPLPEETEIKISEPIAPTGPTVAAAGSANALPFKAQHSGLVGIVAGHKGYDPGAVCPDGLTEAEITDTIAREVVSLLERRGVQTNLLEEFDERLTGYQADALISIHADSCNVPGATGFKVARVTDSAIPDAEDLLVTCLNDEYAAYTGLSQHPSTITDGMTNYHAFSEIAPYTPGAIIETGFLLGDRFILQNKPKIVARGVAAGILCFLDKK